MRALGFKKHGDIDNILLFECEMPTPAAHEVLLKVKASAFNHLDILVRNGWHGLVLKLPHICGSDAAGIIAGLGTNVKNLKEGDEVVINPLINTFEDEFTVRGEQSESPGLRVLGEHWPGTHTEYICVPAKNCLKLPKHIDFKSAAACGLVGIASWRMLIRRADLKFGQRVLFLGAGGGLNSFAIQLAKLAGCEVFATTSSEEKIRLAKQLGADIVLNYKTDQNWHKKLMELTQGKGFDVIFENVGQATFSTSMKLARRGGKIVVEGSSSGRVAEINLSYIFTKQLEIIGSAGGNDNDFMHAMQLVFENKVKPVIHTTLPLEEGIDGMKILESGTQFGKIVLEQ